MPKRSRVPERMSPQLVTLASAQPAGDWLYEINFDGYRMLARLLPLRG